MLSIGQLSKLTGCKIPTIRYYEDIGLLPLPSRSEGNQRRYQQRHVTRLKFILHARDLGFSLDAIRELSSLSESDQQCHEADSIAERQLQEVNRKINHLMALRRELQQMIDACRSGQSDGCSVMETLSDHRFCLDDHTEKATK